MLKKDSSYLLAWLVVYMIGILTSYIGSIILALELNVEFLVLLVIGIIINGCWIMVNNTFKLIQRENSLLSGMRSINRFIFLITK